MGNESNNIVHLRAILFETMRKLKDGTINIENAKAVSDIGQVIINSAKVEVDAMRAAGIEGSGFIPTAPPSDQQNGIARLPGKTIHRCK